MSIDILTAREKLRNILGVPYPENVYNMGISLQEAAPCLTVTLKNPDPTFVLPEHIDGFKIKIKYIPEGTKLDPEDL